MSYEYVDELSVEGRKRYLEKLQVANLKKCPYRLPEGSWSSHLIAWPKLQYPGLYDYLINFPCMYCSHFHVVYSENLSTAITYFMYLSFTASNVRLAGAEFHALRSEDFWRTLSFIFGVRR